MQNDATVFVVDDDAGMRDSLRWLLESVSLAVEAYATAEEFLAIYDPGRPGCLVLDLRMPGMSGLELQQELQARRAVLPIIIITAYGEVPAAVRAMKAGAIDFLEKPFSDQLLLDRVQRALETDRHEREHRSSQAKVAGRLARLTTRERQVMEGVVAGKANKVIAADLGISQKTVEAHRARVMHKLEVDSVPELVRFAAFEAPPLNLPAPD